ncbi:hypothetical protein MTY66_17190 [Mycolicibacterium sp. TY66]|nr:hypothetical protein MTY66_17190 [Mycolicibacterium sp. TY66]
MNATATLPATSATPIHTKPEPDIKLTDCIDITSPTAASTHTAAATAALLLLAALAGGGAPGAVGTLHSAPFQ